MASTTQETQARPDPLARHDLLSHRDPRWQGLEKMLADGLMYDAIIEEIDGRRIRIGDHWLTDFASCNYLGFDLEPQIMDAITTEIHRWGTHPSWSRMLGNPRLYPRIEQRLAELLAGSGPDTPEVMVLPTITHIHMSVLPLLAGVGSIFLDRQAHKTIFDGCVYARGLGARLQRFHDLDELRQQLRIAPVGGAAGARLVCIDGVNSMTGNVPDLAKLTTLCREYDATLYVDDAHGFGVLGERRVDEASPYGMRGNSVIRHLGGTYDNVVLVGGFSKAYSSLLAFLTVPPGWHNLLKVAAPPYLYSGPSPTASLASVLSGMDVNDDRGDTIRAELYRLSARVLAHIRELGAFTPNTLGTPVIELPLAPDRDLTTVERLLWDRGIYVTMAPYPMVPRSQVGFRIQVTAINTDEQIDHLNTVLTELADRGDLLLTPTS